MTRRVRLTPFMPSPQITQQASGRRSATDTACLRGDDPVRRQGATRRTASGQARVAGLNGTSEPDSAERSRAGRFLENGWMILITKSSSEQHGYELGAGYRRPSATSGPMRLASGSPRLEFRRFPSWSMDDEFQVPSSQRGSQTREEANRCARRPHRAAVDEELKLWCVGHLLRPGAHRVTET